MKVQSFTSLAACPIANNKIQLLNSLWIESAEEAIAMFSALEKTSTNATLEEVKTASYSILSSAIPLERMKVLQSPVPSRHLGLMIDDKDRADLLARQTAVKSGRSACAFEGPLPNTIRLTNQMPPIKDQGSRGTCVAFASVALREFLEKSKADFSEQFFYWACKDLDGDQMPGTRLTTAMSAFDIHGVCLSSDWPYVSHDIAGNEGQHPAPESAIKNAKDYRIQTRHVMASRIQNYKHVLAGDDGKGGMPVVIGTEVFDSWMRSYETQRTGKITMPFPGENSVGGHAWCIVGYVDKAGVPGGGYFLVRNSWGKDWAVESPEQQGYAMMPYAYVEQFAHDAFTGGKEESSEKNVINANGIIQKDIWAPFIRKLENGARDCEEKFCRQGTPIICHPDKPDIFMIDDPLGKNRVLFKERGFSWVIKGSEAFLKQHKQFHEIGTSFQDAISQNLAETVSKKRENSIRAGDETYFPDHCLPWYSVLIPWQIQFSKIEKKSFSKELAEIVWRQAGVPADMKNTKEWKEKLEDVNLLSIYKLSSFSADILVVAAFVSPVEITGEGLHFSAPTTKIIESIRMFVADWQQTVSGRKPLYVYYTLGSGLSWPEGQKGIEAGGEGIQFSWRVSLDKAWKIIEHPSTSTRTSFRNFLERMQPITWRERVSIVRNEVQRLIEIAEPAISVSKIVSTVKYRKTTVKRILLQIQKDSPDKFSIYKIKSGQLSGELAIQERTNSEVSSLTEASLRRGVIKRHLLLLASAAIAVAIGKLSMIYGQDKTGLSGFLLAMFFCYSTSLIQKQINRRASEERE